MKEDAINLCKGGVANVIAVPKLGSGLTEYTIVTIEGLIRLYTSVADSTLLMKETLDKSVLQEGVPG